MSLEVGLPDNFLKGFTVNPIEGREDSIKFAGSLNTAIGASLVHPPLALQHNTSQGRGK